MSQDILNAPLYATLLTDIKQRIRHAQTRAWLAVNAELIRLYWEIGALIDSRQREEGWGTGVIPRLARDLRNELPEEKGFSERNIKRMLAFYREYPDLAFVPQAVAQITVVPKVQQAAAQITVAQEITRSHALRGNASTARCAEHPAEHRCCKNQRPFVGLGVYGAQRAQTAFPRSAWERGEIA